MPAQACTLIRQLLIAVDSCNINLDSCKVPLFVYLMLFVSLMLFVCLMFACLLFSC